MGYIQTIRRPYKIEAGTVETTADENGIVTINFKTDFSKPPIVTVTPFPFTRTIDSEEVTYYPRATLLEVTNTYAKVQLDVGVWSYTPDKTVSYYVGQETSEVVSDVSASTKLFVTGASLYTTTVTYISSVSTDSAVTSVLELTRTAYWPNCYAYWRLVDDPTSEPDTGCYAFCDYTAKEYYLYSTSSSKYSWVYDVQYSTDTFVTSISRSNKSVVYDIDLSGDYAITSLTLSKSSVVGSPTTYDIPASDHRHASQIDSLHIIKPANYTVKINYIAIEIL